MTGNLLANNGNGVDSDWDHNQLTVLTVGVFLTGHGSVSASADGSFTYTPTLDYNGSDSFDYAVSDGHGGQATAMATIEVLPVNDPAIIGGELTGAVTEDTLLIATGNLTISDVDSPGEFPRRTL